MKDWARAAVGFSAMIALAVLAGCTGTDATLGVSGDADPKLSAAEQAALPPVADGTTTVYFLPIVGAPVEKVTALSRELSARAKENGVTLRPSGANDTVHDIRGYFSAFAENGATTVVHVWDVFDQQGQRVHRYQGQEVIASSAAEPWNAVSNEDMEKIAVLVLADYNRWRTGASGA